MQEWVEKLLVLQDKDTRIRKLQDQLRSVPVERQRAEAEATSADDAYEEAHTHKQQVQKAIKDLELKVDSIETKMRDFQTKSTMIKNNEEYKAALHQIETCRNQIGDMEDRELELMEQLEAANSLLADRKKMQNAAQTRSREMLGDLDTRAKNCTAQIAKLKKEREDAAKASPSDALSLYERLRKGRRGKMGAPILVALRDSICDGCHMTVTAQVRVNVIKGLSITCEQCGALLYDDN